jgi:hypothetical protein
MVTGWHEDMGNAANTSKILRDLWQLRAKSHREACMQALLGKTTSGLIMIAPKLV